MISTTFQGFPVWLLNFPPEWSSRVQIRAMVATTGQQSLTGRQFRQALGTSLRCRIRYRSTLLLPQMAQLRNAIASQQDEPVVVPAWPFMLRGADWSSSTVSGGIHIGWMEGWSSWEFNPSTPAAWDWVAPALHGRLQVELPSLMRPDVGEVGFMLEEDGAADLAIVPAAATWSNGPALNDATVPVVFPYRVDWVTAPRGGRPKVEVMRSRIGESPRIQSSVFYPQNPSLEAEGVVSLTGRSEISGMLRWWQDRSADVGAHYVNTLSQAGEIAASASAGAGSIQLADASLLGSYRYLALSDLVGVQIVRAGSPVGNSVPLVSSLSRAVTPTGTVVTLAALARHAGDDLEISFESPEIASCRLSWEEVREEYVIPDLAAAPAESRGVTMGAGAVKAWLYRIGVDRAGAQTVYLRTSYERDLEADSLTWIASAMTHSEIRQSVQLDRDELVLEGTAESYFLEFLPGRLTSRVLLDVYECDVSGGTASNLVHRWSGEVAKVSFQGPRVRASCAGPYAVFDRPVPRVLMQAGCNHALFDSRCGLARSDWTFGAAVNASTTGNQVVLKSWSRTGGLPTGWGFADYFALGYLERTLAGVTERWTILASSAFASPLITVTLDRPASWTADQAVTVVPGCDGRKETCRTYNVGTNPTGKFGNYTRFGGFPFVPPSDPKFTGLRRTESNYGKK